MPKEETEEYLETVLDIAGKTGRAKTTDIAKRLRVAPASVTEVLQRLARKGMVSYEPYRGVSLTSKGIAIASKIKRKHRLLEVFLDKVLRLRREHIHEQACSMEHTLSEETANALCRLLKAPARCPHGGLINPCEKRIESCNDCEIAADKTTESDARRRNLLPLAELVPSQRGKIVFIRGSQKVVQRLSDLGLTPETEIVMVRKTPMGGPIEISVRRTILAIDSDISDNIYLEIESV